MSETAAPAESAESIQGEMNETEAPAESTEFIAQRGYESIFILDPELAEEAQSNLVQRLEETVRSNQGEVLQHVVWGTRKMAYAVKKRRRGVYHILYLSRSHQALQALEKIYRVDERVLKWMTVGVESVGKSVADFEKLRLEILRQEKAAATQTQGDLEQPPRERF